MNSERIIKLWQFIAWSLLVLIVGFTIGFNYEQSMVSHTIPEINKAIYILEYAREGHQIRVDRGIDSVYGSVSEQLEWVENYNWLIDFVKKTRRD